MHFVISRPRSRSATLVALLFSSWLLPALPLAAMELDRIIAVVDETVVLQSELDEQLQRVREQMRQQGGNMPPVTVLEKQLLERLIVEKVQLQLAERMGMQVSEPMLDRAIADIAERNDVSVEQFRQVLEQENVDYADFREDIRRQILISELTRNEVEDKIVVTPAEIDAFLANQVSQGETDTQYRLSQLLVAAAEGDREGRAAARAHAEELLAQLRAGADFATTARGIPGSPRANEGGDLGWRKANEVPSLFADFAARANKGDLSGLIESSSGFHIAQLTDRRDGEPVMIEQAKARHILIQLNELVTKEDARTRLQQLRLRLEGGDDFAALARTHSDDRASALAGGDLGWVSPGQMVPEFDQMLARTPVGGISPPFETQYGWHILQVLDRRSHDSTEETLRAKARAAILQRKVDEEHQNWLRRLRDEAYVEYRLLEE
ncbi:MAG: peptidylprolyl isomerase [Gammaproteobacteria bacterium]|nr:peptidylprolyl isomerase [Gammaproteobacteria bacterium]